MLYVQNRFRFFFASTPQQGFHITPEIVHAFSKVGKPVSRVTVIGSKPSLRSFVVANVHNVFQRIKFVHFAKVAAKLCRHLEDCLEVDFIF